MKNTVIYLAGLLLAYYLMIMYDAPYLYRIFWGGAALLFICGGQALYIVLHTEIRITASHPAVKVGESAGIRIQAEYNGIIPVYCLRVRLGYRNNLNRKEAVKWLKIYMKGKRKAEVTVDLKSSYCGLMYAELSRVQGSDYLRLTSMSKRLRGQAKIAVMPRIYEIPLTLSASLRGFLADSSEYSKETSGDDPSEIFGIRDYRPGDRMQWVHWKMTAKSEGYAVKEFSKPEGYPLVLFLDLSAEIREEDQLRCMHRMIETAASLSNSLLGQECHHYISWCDRNMMINRAGVRSEEELHIALGLILQIQTNQNQGEWETMYCEMYGRESYGRFLMITLSGMVKSAGQTLCRFDSEHLKESLIGLNLEI